MPSSFLIHPTQRLVYARVTGVATLDDFRMLRAGIAADASFDPAFDVVFDLCDADLGELSVATIQTLAGARTSLQASARRAIVANTDGKFGLARMFEIHRELSVGSQPIMVVHSLEEAMDWLGVPHFDPRQPSR